MYHSVMVNQREKQGYKSDIWGIQLVVPGKRKLWFKPVTNATLYIDKKWPSIAGLNLLVVARWTLATYNWILSLNVFFIPNSCCTKVCQQGESYLKWVTHMALIRI